MRAVLVLMLVPWLGGCASVHTRPDADDGRLRVLSARGLRARHVVIPHADHLLLDASSRVPEAGHPDTAVHAMALRALTDAVVTTERSGP